MNINHGRPSISRADILEVVRVLESGHVSSGPEVIALENEMAASHSRSCGLSFNSWTSAAFAMFLQLARSDSRRKVLVPSFTFSASINVIVNAGLEPVFLDISPETFSLEYDSVARKIGPDVLAVMIVHYAGFVSPDTSRIAQLCSDNGVLFVEDCAESLGATDRHGKPAGSFGEAIYSFFATKNITAGEGGMLLSDNQKLVDKLRLLRGHGIGSPSPHPWNRDASVPGQNFRLSNVHAALGLSQFRRLAELNRRRATRAEIYYAELQGIERISLPDLDLFGAPSWQMFPVMLDSSLDRNAVVWELRGRGIEASVHFDPPVHRQTAYRNDEVSLPQTDFVSSTVVTLPMHPGLASEDVLAVARAIGDIVAR